MDITPKQVARFWSYVDRTNGPLACWIWTRSKIANGYGNFWIGEDTQHGKVVLATHIALTLDGRPKPFSKAKALHTCHRPPCCNPLHLYWGTQLDNMKDAIEAGRFPVRSGEANAASRFMDDEIYRIRDMWDQSLPPSYIAAQMNTTRQNVWRIGTRRVWKHLPER